MSNFYLYTTASTHGPLLQKCINANKDGDRYLAEVIAIMTQMLDGNGSADAHFATIQARFGFENVAAARAAFNELNAAFSKTKSDGPVEFVRAARDQLYAKLTI